MAYCSYRLGSGHVCLLAQQGTFGTYPTDVA